MQSLEISTQYQEALHIVPSYSCRERVLIVDDSKLVRRMFVHFLGERYDCEEAESFEAAIAALKRGEFSVVISDIIMPGLSGIELLRRIQEDYPEIAVIMVSGVDRPQRVLDALRLGAFDFLIKPCEADIFRSSMLLCPPANRHGLITGLSY